jgi:hypothetical protein
MIRIGIWFDPRHCAYGGPTVVFLGTILGLLQDAERRKKPCILLFNEPGDINWSLDMSENIDYMTQKAPNVLIGPACFTNSDVAVKDDELMNHPLWKYGRNTVVPSKWYGHFINRGLPYLETTKSEGRRLFIWGAGVDIDRFCPNPQIPKTQDFFIYFKSQNYEHLYTINAFLFKNYFNFRGSILTYYTYTPDMLVAAARSSRFCIMLDRTETQGLASLEIMACNCPLFVLDCNEHVHESKDIAYTMKGASSVPCMDDRCGMKSGFETLGRDFAFFLQKLGSYTPRDYVLESYSFEASARKLRNLLELI